MMLKTLTAATAAALLALSGVAFAQSSGSSSGSTGMGSVRQRRRRLVGQQHHFAVERQLVLGQRDHASATPSSRQLVVGQQPRTLHVRATARRPVRRAATPASASA